MTFLILVEAGPGMGKTSLAYYYSQKWAKDELKAFDAVALFLCMTCVYVKMIHDHCTPCLASSS